MAYGEKFCLHRPSAYGRVMWETHPWLRTKSYWLLTLAFSVALGLIPAAAADAIWIWPVSTLIILAAIFIADLLTDQD